MSEIVKIEHIMDHIVEVLINRPENYNTFNTELRLSLAENLRKIDQNKDTRICLLYTSPSPRDEKVSRMPSSA